MSGHSYIELYQTDRSPVNQPTSACTCPFHPAATNCNCVQAQAQINALWAAVSYYTHNNQPKSAAPLLAQIERLHSLKTPAQKKAGAA